MSSFRGFFGILAGGGGGDGVVEGHDDIRADGDLGVDGNFGGQELRRAVEMGFEIGSIIGNFW